ncbi:GH25 family lysozyme [Streptomyces thioluteus]|uniref:GH25 family lysozyme n=1 Tax=Streptomyces thioluteus TaxID=66431 RepID=UPI003CD0A165
MLHGVDVSSYQSANYPIRGQDFAFVKVTEGMSYTNPRWVAQRDHARSGGLVVGYYHFVTPGSMSAQADRFLGKIALREGDILALDWEHTRRPLRRQGPLDRPRPRPGPGPPRRPLLQPRLLVPPRHHGQRGRRPVDRRPRARGGPGRACSMRGRSTSTTSPAGSTATSRTSPRGRTFGRGRAAAACRRGNCLPSEQARAMEAYAGHGGRCTESDAAGP